MTDESSSVTDKMPDCNWWAAQVRLERNGYNLRSIGESEGDIVSQVSENKSM